MSKTDAIRAMKLARLEEQRRGAPAARPAAAPAPVAGAPNAGAPKSAAKTAPKPAPTASASVDLVPEALCGHTAISGRRCTRPQGHAEKNHRYAS